MRGRDSNSKTGQIFHAGEWLSDRNEDVARTFMSAASRLVSMLLEFSCIQSDKHRDNSRCGSLKARASVLPASPALPHYLPHLLRTLRPNGAKPLKNSGGCFQRARRFAILLLSLKRLA
jgi:hypothetical protein